MMDWEEKTKQKTKINLKHGHSAHQSDSLSSQISNHMMVSFTQNQKNNCYFQIPYFEHFTLSTIETTKPYAQRETFIKTLLK